jgi:hypothetical protein
MFWIKEPMNFPADTTPMSHCLFFCSNKFSIHTNFFSPKKFWDSSLANFVSKEFLKWNIFAFYLLFCLKRVFIVAVKIKFKTLYMYIYTYI